MFRRFFSMPFLVDAAFVGKERSCLTIGLVNCHGKPTAATRREIFHGGLWCCSRSLVWNGMMSLGPSWHYDLFQCGVARHVRQCRLICNLDLGAARFGGGRLLAGRHAQVRYGSAWQNDFRPRRARSPTVCGSGSGAFAWCQSIVTGFRSSGDGVVWPLP